jgi:hypothetical protein
VEVTHESLQKYVGGQMEIQNRDGSDLHRGDVESITLTDTELQVRFAWIGKWVGDHVWAKADKLDWTISTVIGEELDLKEIATGTPLQFQTMFLGDTVVNFPPRGKRLDPTKLIEPEPAEEAAAE